jgi:hypothetical protein
MARQVRGLWHPFKRNAARQNLEIGDNHRDSPYVIDLTSVTEECHASGVGGAANELTQRNRGNIHCGARREHASFLGKEHDTSLPRAEAMRKTLHFLDQGAFAH